MSDFQWYRDRLEDLSLLENAIHIEGQVLVPLGGKRISGCTYFNGKDKADKAISRINQYNFENHSNNGFQNVRLVDYGEGYWEVVWGEDVIKKTKSLRERGRMFGYREEILFD